MTLDHAELLRHLAYDADTGVFTRLVGNKLAAKKHQAGSVAGGEDGSGYRRIRIGRIRYKAHRLAWFYVHGQWPTGQIDHMDGDRGNDRIANLRDVAPAINCQNQSKPRSDNTSGYLGVHWNSQVGKFMARVGLAGRRHLAGYFDDPKEAHAAYLSLKAKIHEGFVGG